MLKRNSVPNLKSISQKKHECMLLVCNEFLLTCSKDMFFNLVSSPAGTIQHKQKNDKKWNRKINKNQLFIVENVYGFHLQRNHS